MNKLTEFAQKSIGIPFVENGREGNSGWDCWGLCVEAYKLLDIDLSKYEHIDSFDFKKAAEEIARQTENWIPVPWGQERPWDVINLRASHVGIVVTRGKMLHVLDGPGTCLTSYHHPTWKDRVLGFYRYGKPSKV